MTASRRLHRLVTGRVPGRPVGRVRALVGCSALLKGCVLGPEALALASPGSFRMPWFAGVPVPGPSAMAALCVLWFATALAFAVGWRARASGAVLAGLIAGAMALDAQLYSNHLILMLMLVALLVLADAGAAVSLDARRRGDRETVPAWPVFLLKVQLSAVYAFAALSKINPQYLSGGVIATALRSGPLALPDAWRTPDVLAPMAVASIFAELLLAFGLWSDRWRRSALVLGLALHAGMIAMIVDPFCIALFAIETTAMYLLFPLPSPGTGRVATRAALS